MDRLRRALGAGRAAPATRAAADGTAAPARPARTRRRPLRPVSRNLLAAAAGRAGLRLRVHLLAPTRRVAGARRLGRARGPARRATAGRRADRVVARVDAEHRGTGGNEATAAGPRAVRREAGRTPQEAQ